MDLSDTRVALYGRLLGGPRPALEATIAARGGTVERDLTRRSDLLVVGRGSLNLIPSGSLLRKLTAAASQGVPVVGEARFRARLAGGAEPAPTYPLDRVTPPAPLATVLNAFDLIHLQDGCIRFADVQALRTAGALADEGHEVSSVVRIMLRARDVAPSGRHRIVSHDGQPRLEWDDGVTGLDGQRFLPLEDQPDLDALFDQAMLAEAEGQLDAAARGYEMCAQMDRRDPIAPFNLGNVLAAQDNPEAAIHRFGQALARDPDFAECYHNRARVLEASGRPDAAEADWRAALAIDPDFGHALFNLAQLRLRCDDTVEAVDLFDRFLALGPEPEWRAIAVKARAVAAAAARKTGET